MLKQLFKDLKALPVNKKPLKHNLLTNTLLKLVPLLLDVPCTDDSMLHRLFELWVNCIKFNFDHFVAKEGQQWHLQAICRYICDMAFVNTAAEVPNSPRPAYYSHVVVHKPTFGIAAHANGARVQMGLHYLVQLLGVLIDRKEEPSETRLSTAERIKVQSMLLFYGDPHLLGLFIHNTL